VPEEPGRGEPDDRDADDAEALRPAHAAEEHPPQQDEHHEAERPLHPERKAAESRPDGFDAESRGAQEHDRDHARPQPQRFGRTLFAALH
jgi:hypothetical protein